MDGPLKVRPVKVRKVKPTLAVKPIAKPKPVVRPVARPKPVKRIRGPKGAPEGGVDRLFHLDPWKLDSARMFHYANALRWFNELGPKQVGIRPDLSVEVHTHDGRVEVIPAIVMVTRDHRYAFGFVGAKVRGQDTDGLVWEMDQYDKEFARLTRQWTTGD